MTSRIASSFYRAALLAAVGGALLPHTATAVTLNGFKGQGMETLYGSYGPGGDCKRQPLLVVDDRGFTFTVAGQTTTRARVEYAASFMGPQYEGPTMVFFPFPQSDSEPGPVLMYMNYDDKPGEVRFESNAGPGQRLNAMQTALVSAPLKLCSGTVPAAALEAQAQAQAQAQAAAAAAAVPATPAEWSNLANLAGRFVSETGADSVDLFGRGAIAAALRTRLGAKFAALETNLSVASPLQRQGSIYFLAGNAEHRGGEEQAYILLDPARRAIQVGLWEKGKLTVYGPSGARIPLPRDIASMVENSPSEDAVPLPGTPWELRPAQGREPIAYVDAAGSTRYQAFSVFCDGTRPVLAVLTTRPLAGQTHTVTWNFNGRLIDVVVQRGNTQGTFWQAYLTGSPLVAMLAQSSGEVLLRLDGQLEGQASLTGSTATLRAALRTCARI